MASKNVADYVRTIPDFPQPGIMFRDITTVLQDAEGLRTMRTLGRNMAHMLKKLDGDWPETDEPRAVTNFIR